jgi:excisionase family DNA binding protein
MTDIGAGPLLWTSRQAAQALAISERKLWDLTNRGLIPCVRIGRSVRYHVDDIHRWIESQKTTSAASQGTAEMT